MLHFRWEASSAMSERRQDQTVPSFSEVFSPLADHFFPDGCPLLSSNDVVDDVEAKYLQDAWPLRTAFHRRETVSADAALQAISHIRDYAESHGLDPAEMVAVAFVAVTILPRSRSTQNAIGTVIRSPLQDGSATHFVTLIHSLLPKNHNESSDDRRQMDASLPVIFSRLLVAGCCFRGVLGKGGAQQEVRQSILRFLLLAKLYCDRESAFMEKKCFPWTVIYQWALHPKTAPDALRLLWHAALPIPVFRLNQLERFHSKLLVTKNYAVAEAVAAFLARYYGNPVWQEAGSLKGASGDWKDFPDADWESIFSGWSPRRHGICFHSFDDASKMSNAWDSSRSQQQNNSHHVLQTNPSKRRRLSTRRDLQPFCSYIRSLLSETASTREPSRFRMIREHSLCVATSTAVEISEDPFIQHLFALGADKRTELHVRNVLPYRLHEQWYESATMHSSRCRLLSALADWGIRSGSIPDEAQVFVQRCVLAFWDGIVDNELGRLLLFGVLPLLCPESQTNVEHPISIIDEVEPFVTPGSKHLRYIAVSCVFSDLVFRWYCVNCPSTGDLDESLVSGLERLVQRAEDCILNGFLNTDENDEFLRTAAMDLHDSICDIHTSRSPSVLSRVHSPSFALLRQLLLSSSCLNIDRACGILLRYNGIYQSWKDNVLAGISDSPLGPFDRSEGLKKIRLFGNFVDTFRSILWDASLPRNYSTIIGDNNIDGADETSFLVDRHIRRKTANALSKAHGSKLSLDIAQGATFAQIAFDFIDVKISRQTQSDQSSLGQVRSTVKNQYLRYLQERGFNSLHIFLSSFANNTYMSQ